MKRILVSIYDSKAEVYNEPSPAHNEAVAIRNFTDAVRNIDHLSANRGDFSLVMVAEFDATTGVVTPVSPAKVLMDGRSVADA